MTECDCPVTAKVGRLLSSSAGFVTIGFEFRKVPRIIFPLSKSNSISKRTRQGRVLCRRDEYANYHSQVTDSHLYFVASFFMIMTVFLAAFLFL